MRQTSGSQTHTHTHTEKIHFLNLRCLKLQVYTTLQTLIVYFSCIFNVLQTIYRQDKYTELLKNAQKC